jgi:hypothetical protein
VTVMESASRPSGKRLQGKWHEGGTKLRIPYLWGRGEEVFRLDNLPVAMLASGKGNWHANL